MFDVMKVNEKINELRKERGIGLYELADMLDERYSTIQRFNRGENIFDAEGYAKLMKIFNVRLEEILKDEKGVYVLESFIKNDFDNYKKSHTITAIEYVNVVSLLQWDDAQLLYEALAEPLTKEQLVYAACFIESDELERLAKEIYVNDGIKGIIGISQYLDYDLIEAWIDGLTIDEILPILSSISVIALRKIAYQEYEQSGLEGLIKIAKYIDKDTLHELSKRATKEYGYDCLIPIEECFIYDN